jgi:hypothetical protein
MCLDVRRRALSQLTVWNTDTLGVFPRASPTAGPVSGQAYSNRSGKLAGNYRLVMDRSSLDVQRSLILLSFQFDFSRKPTALQMRHSNQVFSRDNQLDRRTGSFFRYVARSVAFNNLASYSPRIQLARKSVRRVKCENPLSRPPCESAKRAKGDPCNMPL